MTRAIHVFRTPDRFVVGTVGMPGERTFFLQVRQGNAITSVALEKAQVAALSERVDQLLDEAATRTEPGEIPEAASPALADTGSLDAPIVEEFRVGAMALGWDEANSLVVIEAHAVTEDDMEIPDIGDDEAADRLASIASLVPWMKGTPCSWRWPARWPRLAATPPSVNGAPHSSSGWVIAP